jgi:hypothetical protein
MRPWQYSSYRSNTRWSICSCVTPDPATCSITSDIGKPLLEKRQFATFPAVFQGGGSHDFKEALPAAKIIGQNGKLLR